MRRIAKADPALLALTIANCLLVYGAWGLRWTLVLRPVARVRWWPAQRALMASIFVNTVVPFARSLGGLVRAALLAQRTNVPIATLYAPTLIDQIGYSTASLCLGALMIPAASWSRSRAHSGWIVAGILGAMLVVAAVSTRRRRGAWVLSWVRTKLPGAGGSVELGVQAARAVLQRPYTWILLVVGGAVVWALNVITVLLAARTMGVPIGFAAAAAAWSVGSVAGIASGTPGGIGTTESAAVVPLIAMGVAPQDAIACFLLARLLQYLTALTIGGAAILTSGAPPKAAFSSRIVDTAS